MGEGRGGGRRGLAMLGCWVAGPLRRVVGTSLAVVLVTLGGIAVGLLVGGRTQQDVGPFEATFSLSPSMHGGTDVQVPPLGALRVRSHDGPAHLSIDLGSLDSARTVDLLNSPDGVARASATAVDDVTDGVARLILQAIAVSVLGAMLAAAVVFRSMRRVATCGGLALLIMASSLAVAAGTLRREALAEPTYEGLLTNAGTVVGDARHIVDQYDAYRGQLQSLVTNVGRLYTTISTLPVYEPADGTTKVLHVSDLHLNPAAWSVIATVVTQFDIDVVVDTGDINDWGSEPEASFVSQIGSLGIPYVYVRGNHDSARTQGAVDRQPNAIVLDNEVADVAGLRIAGIGDPRFTPDKRSGGDPARGPTPADATPNATDGGAASDDRTRAGLAVVARKLAQTVEAGPPVDIALIHDPTGAAPLAGVVPLVLAGHRHERETSDLNVVEPSRVPRTRLLVQGSTGGAGLRGLEGGEPVPLQLSVLYLDADRTLRAYDEITVDGTGRAGVTLLRHLVR